MSDLLLIFPPQWSPFQPALSLPSLAAWLRRSGFDVQCVDLNVLFYEWLLSDECAALLLEHLAQTDWTADVKLAYRTTFQSVGDFRHDLDRLRSVRSGRGGVDHEDYVTAHYLAVKSLETYLDAVSQVSHDFTISPYDFRLSAGNLDVPELEHRVVTPPALLDRFSRAAVRDHILSKQPAVIGISCIGQEQLYFTLLLGSLIKEHVDTPVLVGGTIFSRIFERGGLKPQWFQRYFDIIVRNEGEKPAERLLSNLTEQRPLTDGVPGIVYLAGGDILSSRPSAPLATSDIPIPDFGDMPLGHYISAEITLPLLTARGCYWGKCEFCHHGMVYGEKYGAYSVDYILRSVEELSKRYGVRHFAFNDEAIPPKVMRSLGRVFPPSAETNWNFTGLIKFEKYFAREDFVNLHRIGFRSLYVGLESASERVLDLMKKNNKRETVVRNLTDATTAGIWMHCFLFFGFPGETEDDARETYDFVLSNSDIISSFGTAAFVLEHNAPIFHHVADFGVRLLDIDKNNVDVYYPFEVQEGITPQRAIEWMNAMNDAALDIPNYNAAGWVPRELQLCILSVMPPGELIQKGLGIRNFGGLPRRSRLPDIVSWGYRPGGERGRIIVNRVNGRAISTQGASEELFDLCYREGLELIDIEALVPILFQRLTTQSQRLTSEAVMSPVPAPLAAVVAEAV